MIITKGRKTAFSETTALSGDNVRMDAGEQLAAEIIDAIASGSDVWVFDEILQGPDRLEHARKLLLEKRSAGTDPNDSAFLTSIIDGLEKQSAM